MMRFSIQRDGVANLTAAQLRGALRRAIHKTGEYWHREYLPIHFANRATRRYGYAYRAGESGSGRRYKGSYTYQKANRIAIDGKLPIGETKPLVFSGDSRKRALTQQRIVSAAPSSTRCYVDVRLNAPALSLRHAGSKIDMVREVTTIADLERQQLEIVFGRAFEAEIAALGGTLTRGQVAA